MSLTVYKQHLPYSGTEICTHKHYMTVSDSGLCDYCYFEDSILLGHDSVSVDDQILAYQGSVGFIHFFDMLGSNYSWIQHRIPQKWNP